MSKRKSSKRVEVTPPIRHYVHFDKSSGFITGWGSTNTPPDPTGSLEVPEAADISTPTIYRVDLATCQLIELSEIEQADRAAPNQLDINDAIRSELTRSDFTQLLDYPIDDAKRQSWRDYRQALRRLSDLADPVEQALAFPLSPIGNDPIPTIRVRASALRKMKD